MFRTVITASGTAAADWSVTVPRMVPRSCAIPDAVMKSNKAKHRLSLDIWTPLCRTDLVFETVCNTLRQGYHIPLFGIRQGKAPQKRHEGSPTVFSVLD